MINRISISYDFVIFMYIMFHLLCFFPVWSFLYFSNNFIYLVRFAFLFYSLSLVLHLFEMPLVSYILLIVTISEFTFLFLFSSHTFSCIISTCQTVNKSFCRSIHLLVGWSLSTSRFFKKGYGDRTSWVSMCL